MGYTVSLARHYQLVSDLEIAKRERDEARRERDEALGHEENLFTVKNAACYWRRECERTTSERDEAHADAKKYKERLEDLRSFCAGMEAGADSLRSERDEAREKASHWERVYRKDTTLDLEIIRELREEHDEARKKLEELEYGEGYWRDKGRRLYRQLIQLGKEHKALKGEHDEARRVAARLWQQCEAADKMWRMIVTAALDGDGTLFPDLDIINAYADVRLKPPEEKGVTELILRDQKEIRCGESEGVG